MEHNRFDEQHRNNCQSCYDGYLDFLQDEVDAGLADINEDEEDAE
jgi:hypothetical protein